MKMPLKYGIPLLIVLWLASGFTEYGQGKTLLMALAMGVAMWTAFSLPRPRRRKPNYQDEVEKAEAEEEAGNEETDKASAPISPYGGTNVPGNGSGRPLTRPTGQNEKES